MCPFSILPSDIWDGYGLENIFPSINFHIATPLEFGDSQHREKKNKQIIPRNDMIFSTNKNKCVHLFICIDKTDTAV